MTFPCFPMGEFLAPPHETGRSICQTVRPDEWVVCVTFGGPRSFLQNTLVSPKVFVLLCFSLVTINIFKNRRPSFTICYTMCFEASFGRFLGLGLALGQWGQQGQGCAHVFQPVSLHLVELLYRSVGCNIYSKSVEKY